MERIEELAYLSLLVYDPQCLTLAYLLIIKGFPYAFKLTRQVGNPFSDSSKPSKRILYSAHRVP